MGRFINELKQADADRTLESISLDDIYSYHRGASVWHVAIENQSPQVGLMELKVGDKIKIYQANFVRNRGYGYNSRTNRNGFYSLNKVRIFANTAEYLSFL